ncbi:hypothetical protein KUTeg_009262 [Tegillarca granosa]|uniref:Uncharacterized protein n=1 Tax=Tegillarca granosa TaxID=220873 RepID=A0ABQ9FBF6_TEGGR|nr:hypothetical protein KUTeg_009262 [Tegillarca granosa]
MSDFSSIFPKKPSSLLQRRRCRPLKLSIPKKRLVYDEIVKDIYKPQDFSKAEADQDSLKTEAESEPELVINDTIPIEEIPDDKLTENCLEKPSIIEDNKELCRFGIEGNIFVVAKQFKG